MKKIKVKLASCLLSSMLLVACGGSDAPTANSDDGSSIAAGGVVVITSIDGYYKNGLLFLDVNGNGELDLDSDTIFGLTDESGQYAIPEGTTGTLGLQTLVPGGDMQKSLISSDSAYAGIYTVDMDFPDQAVSSEIVLQAPATSKIVSPVTDLVSILMTEGSTEAEAQSAVVDALGLTAGTDLYIDFVAADTADAQLHKVAQILADSKAANTDDDYTDNALLVAQAAAAQVETIIADDAANGTDDLSDNSVSAVITVDISTAEVTTTTVSNSTATVSNSVYTAVQTELEALSVIEGEVLTTFTSVQSLELLVDDDPDQTTVALSIQGADSDGSLTTGGITISISDNKLVLSSTDVTATEDVSIVLLAEDQYSDGSKASNVYVEFTLDVNGTPTVNATTEASLAATIADWELVVGESVDKTLNISELFEDPDDDTLTYDGGITTTGLEVEFSGTTLSVTGTPEVEDESSTLTLSASDASGSKFVEFALPTVITVDSDSDGVDDYLDTFPNDATETSDTDGDGVGDNADAFPNDASETVDSDEDGVGDNADTFPNDVTETSDTDGDGVGDNADAFPNDATETSDTDGDGIGDNADTDEETTNTSPLIGTWRNAEDILTFNTDGTYEHTNLQDDDEDCTVGTETGAYTYDEATGAITVTSMTTNGDGDCGFYDKDGIGPDDDDSFVLSEAGTNGNYLVFAIDEDSEIYEENSMTVYKVLDTSASDFVATNSNFFFLDLALDDGDIEFSYDDVQWSSANNILSSTCYVFDFASKEFADCTDTDDSDYILTSEGWSYAEYGVSTLTPQSDGSMVYADNIESETITGVEWSLSGSNIYQFQKSVGIEDSLLTYFDDSATFSDDAALYVMTSVSNSEPVYSLWLNSCGDNSEYQVADTGLCNSFTATMLEGNEAASDLQVESIAQITHDSAFDSNQDARSFEGMYYNNWAIRLLSDNTVDVYSNLDWYGGTNIKADGTVTWESVIVKEGTDGETTLIKFSTEDESLSDFNQLNLTELGSYVRGVDEWGDSDEDDDIDIMLNSIAAQDLLNAFDTESVDSSSSDSTTSSTLTATVENEEALLTTDISSYDDTSYYNNYLKLIDVQAEEISQISAEFTIDNVLLPTASDDAYGSGTATTIDLRYDNEVRSDSMYQMTARIRIRTNKYNSVIQPFFEICNDADCSSKTQYKPDEESNTLIYNTEVDSLTDINKLSIEWDNDNTSFIFSYGDLTATISVYDFFNDSSLNTEGYNHEDYSFDYAKIQTYFYGGLEGEEASVTSHVDNVYVNDVLYDDFSSGELSEDKWDSSANDSSDYSRIDYSITTGTVSFTDDLGNELAIPDDAMVRIVPRSYSDVGNYSMALICDIDENGGFGTDCLIYDDQQEDFDAVLADSTETYQFVVFKNHLNTEEYHWDCGEDLYRDVDLEDGSSISSWWNETIVVTDSDYQDRSGETCSD